MQSRVLAILIAVVLALVATVALVVYVNGADRRVLDGQKPVYVLVAKETIKAGTSGEDAQNGDLIERKVVASASVVLGNVVSLDQLKNRFASVDIVKGEQLLLRRWVGAEDVAGRRLLQIPEDHQALSIALDMERQVAGFVTPGDKVGMVITRPRGDAGEETEFLLQNVQVLAVGTTALVNTASQGGGGRVNQGKGSQSLTAVTLAIRQQYVKFVVHAVEQGSIYLTLMPPNADPAAKGPPVGDGNDVPGALE
jgi:pilus assembly protein CpaB